MTMQSEEWRPVAGYEGLYEVSSLGRVRSCEKFVMSRHGTPRKNPQPEKIMKPARKADGYLGLVLAKEGQRQNRKVHRIVCEAFHGPCPVGMECAHEDGDKANNAAGNLSWKPHAANMADQIRHGTRVVGENSKKARLTEGEVLEIRRLRMSGVMGVAIANQFGIHKSTVTLIGQGKNWAHL